MKENAESDMINLQMVAMICAWSLSVLVQPQPPKGVRLSRYYCTRHVMVSHITVNEVIFKDINVLFYQMTKLQVHRCIRQAFAFSYTLIPR